MILSVSLFKCKYTRIVTCFRIPIVVRNQEFVNFHSKNHLLKTPRKRFSSKNAKQSRIWTSVVCYSLLAIGSLIITTENYVSCTAVTGRSMQPTINPDELVMRDWVLLDKRPTRDHSKIERGDIITYKTPRDPNEINIKRVIGLEGDVVSTLGYKNKTVRVPAGYCWVEGDNHLASDDSNRIGPIPLGLLTGRATFVLFPMKRWQFLTRRFPHSRVALNPNCEDEHIKNLPTIVSPNIYEKRL